MPLIGIHGGSTTWTEGHTEAEGLYFVTINVCAHLPSESRLLGHLHARCSTSCERDCKLDQHALQYCIGPIQMLACHVLTVTGP